MVVLEIERTRLRRRTPRAAFDAHTADPLVVFQHAIVAGDQAAWGALYARYHRLVRAWLLRHPAAALAGEVDDALINRAFERFWLYVRPERFASFSGLPELLQYLKLCAHGVLLDEGRAQTRRRAIRGRNPVNIAVADEVIDRETVRALWRAIRAEARDEADLLIVRLSFIHGLKPREIHERHPEHFADIAAVYRVKRNLLDRLRRSEAIRRTAC